MMFTLGLLAGVVLTAAAVVVYGIRTAGDADA
jgi:hypothetical protein